MSYYGLYVPTSTNVEVQNVFVDKLEALKALKLHKEARLKVFDDYDEAFYFATSGEYKSNNKSTFNDEPAYGSKSPTHAASAEKLPFKAPKSQELVLLRKDIEKGNLEKIQKTVWDNPRYLIGLGDTPSILKEGTRYNAIHVTALHNQSNICESILETVGNAQFVQLLHGKKNLETCQEVSNVLLDLYLNMPEKGRSDTPLHLAVKYGAIEVAKVLTSYPQCKMSLNLDGYLPKDVICSRMSNPPANLFDSISLLLRERFYVPVIRSVDSVTPPVVGEPFSSKNPPILNTDPLSPEVEIYAYAGPMDKEKAIAFRKRWKTPPRIRGSPFNIFILNGSSIMSSSFVSPMKEPLNLYSNSSTPIIKRNRRLFPNKSFDNTLTNLRNCNKEEQKQFSNDNKSIGLTKETDQINPNESHIRISNSFNVNQINSNLDNREDSITETNDSFSNLSLNESLDMFNVSFFERNAKLLDTEKGLEIIGRNLAKEQNVGWKEYWKFLGTFIDFTTKEGLQQLEMYLTNKINGGTLHSSIQHKDNNINDLCEALQDFNIRSNKGKDFVQFSQKYISSKIMNEYNSIVSSPKGIKAYICVEKSCQTFAQRFTKIFTNNNEINLEFVMERLDKELKRLRSLVFSYNGDYRFWNVSFKYVHSRFASLIVAYLKKEELDSNTITKVKQCLDEVKLNSVSSDIHCVCEKLNNKLSNLSNIDMPETLITEASCESAWHKEIACFCDFMKDPFKVNRRHKRNNSGDVPRKLYEFIPSEPKTIESIWSFRESNSDSDNDVFLTGSEKDSDDEVYYTPPESVVDITENEKLYGDEDSEQEFKNYIDEDHPTKTDVDVLNVIKDIEIDELLFPNVAKWKKSMLDLSEDELKIANHTLSQPSLRNLSSSSTIL